MSEYQYYEFQALDRPLDAADRQALRALSTRARITASSFTNSYEWGDFKGDPVQLMETWFDLHLYLADWGSRRLMIRWPVHLVDYSQLKAFLGQVEGAELWRAGQFLILDITAEEIEAEDQDDGSGWLSALAPLRSDVLSGDLRLFYLLWLSAVEAGLIGPDEPEPMTGIGPITGALESFAEFFHIDRDLVAAAGEPASDPPAPEAVTSKAVEQVIAALANPEKTAILMQLFDGNAHVRHMLRSLVHQRLRPEAGARQVAARTAGDLRARAKTIRQAREHAQAEKAAAERKRREAAAEMSRRARLGAIAGRGESVWHDIETEIERRNAAGYDKATNLLLDLRTIAMEKGASEDFARRLREIRHRHAQKPRLLERLAKLG